MAWTDDRVDLLRKLWTDGLSASQIAAELGGVTRNAVIGKVHRLGLSGRAKSSSTSNRQKRTSARSSAYPKTSRANSKQGTGTSIPRAAPIVDIPKPTYLMIDLLQLNETTCKFPIGDPQEDNFGFCGTKAKDGDPYCEYHCRLVYQPASERRRQPQTRAQAGASS